MTATTSTRVTTQGPPSLPSANVPASPAELRELRRWHLGTAATAASALPASALPALLAPYRDPARVRHDYPLLLVSGEAGLQVRALGDLLPELAKAATAEPRIVHDNLRRLERRVRLLAGDDAPADAGALLRDAAALLLAELQLPVASAAGVASDLVAMGKALPAGQLLRLHADTPLRLLQAAARVRAAAARAAFARQARTHAEALRVLLQVEAQKDEPAHGASGLQKSLGGLGQQFLDPASLARTVGPHRGSQRTDPERRQRLQQALSALEHHLAADAMPEFVVVHAGATPVVPGASLHADDDVCAAAAARFDGHVATVLAAVRAMQLAELEGRSAYEPERHDPLLAALRWQDLSTDELHLLPVVVAVAPAALLAGRAMQSLTQLLASGRPVQVVALQRPAEDPGGAGNGPGAARLELGYLGIAFRDAYVQQATAARPAHLLAGFERAVRGRSPGLHVVDTGLQGDGREGPLGAFLQASAAIEGRAQPLFQYDPEAGETWARRLDFAHNPAPEADWPVTELEVRGATGTAARLAMAFTFADFALLEPSLLGAFAVVPDTMQSPDLLPLAEYLERPAAASARCLPFVWFAAGDDGVLHRAVVQRGLVHGCRDRLRFWRTLQELAGVRNEHVREAVQRARQEAAESAAREREALQAQQRQELERVRSEATGAAMQGLARMLLELDPAGEAPPAPPRPAGPAAAATATSVAAPPTPATPAAATAPVVAAAPVDDGDDEPWIDSPRCSTCNDCVNLNPLLFAYNENKQARIRDARAGTYAQLVQAAEKCPTRCIHPGKPLNRDEPDLASLVARAAPFRR